MLLAGMGCFVNDSTLLLIILNNYCFIRRLEAVFHFRRVDEELSQSGTDTVMFT